MSAHQPFTGFPARPQATAIPNVFFTDLLPHLETAGELTVVLCALHAFASKRGFPRYITRNELEAQPAVANLRNDQKFRNEFSPEYEKVENKFPADVPAHPEDVRSQHPGPTPAPPPRHVVERGPGGEVPQEPAPIALDHPEQAILRNEQAEAAPAPPPRHVVERGPGGEMPKLRNEGSRGEDPIDAGLRRAVELNILLALTVEQGGERVELFFLNTPADRRAFETVRSGHIDLGRVVRDAKGTAAPRRTPIFALYESHIGTISPLIADELSEAERLYPAEWLESAFREAASQNARSWRYISRILERWAREGPDHATTERGAPDDRYFRGKYGRILKQRLNR